MISYNADKRSSRCHLPPSHFKALNAQILWFAETVLLKFLLLGHCDNESRDLCSQKIEVVSHISYQGCHLWIIQGLTLTWLEIIQDVSTVLFGADSILIWIQKLHGFDSFWRWPCYRTQLCISWTPNRSGITGKPFGSALNVFWPLLNKLLLLVYNVYWHVHNYNAFCA